jgi:hypothetical protein
MLEVGIVFRDPGVDAGAVAGQPPRKVPSAAALQ